MKNKTFAFRISERDLNAARRKAMAAKMTVTDYFTTCALGKEIVVVEGLPELITQLKGIGRNLNQLATLANMGRIQTVDVTACKEHLAVIHAQLSQITERIS
jgi:hypothetical protein